MSLQEIPDFKPGLILPEVAAALNALKSQVRALTEINVDAGSGLILSDGGGAYGVGLDLFIPFWVQINGSGTDANNNPVYAWTEIMPGQRNGWVPKPGGRSGTTTVFPAYEKNNTAGLKTDGSLHVLLYQSFQDLSGGTAQNYVFDAGSAGANIVVEDSTGSPVYNTLVLEVDDASFRITQPAPGTTKLSFFGLQSSANFSSFPSWWKTPGSPGYACPVGAVFIGADCNVYYACNCSAPNCQCQGNCCCWYMLQGTPAPGLSLLDGLVGYWTMDAGFPVSFPDVTGKSGNLVPAPDNSGWGGSLADPYYFYFAAQGINGSALGMDTSQLYPSYPNPGPNVQASATTTGTYTSFSLSVWINVLIGNRGIGFYSITYVFWGNFGFSLNPLSYNQNVPSLGNINPRGDQFQVTASGGTFTNFNLQTNTWYNVVLSYDGNAQTLLIAVNGTIAAFNGVVLSAITGNPVYLNDSASVYMSSGKKVIFDELAIWGRALTQCEIEAIWNGGSANQWPFNNPKSSGTLNLNLKEPLEFVGNQDPTYNPNVPTIEIKNGNLGGVLQFDGTYWKPTEPLSPGQLLQTDPGVFPNIKGTNNLDGGTF